MSESILTAPAPPADARIAYGRAPAQFCDLRLPNGAGPHPCVIVVHGGFWRARYDLEHTGHLCRALGAAGLATWNVEYRRVGDASGGWPGTFQDVAGAAAHLFAIAPDYGLAPDRISVLGHSAGGQLALWLAGWGSVPLESPVRSSPLALRAAVSLAGVLDLRRAWELGLSDGAVGGLLGGGPDEVADRYADASPAELVPLGVRQLLVHGIEDAAVPVEISEAYHGAATARGDESTLLVLPETGHFEPIDPGARVWPAILAAMLPLVG